MQFLAVWTFNVVKNDYLIFRLWVAHYNSDANLNDYAAALAIDNFGNVYVTGMSDGNETYWDYATVKYDSNGNQMWVRRFHNPQENYGYEAATDIAVDQTGNVYVTEPNGKQLLLLPETGKFKDDYTWKYNDYLYGYLKTTPIQVKTEAGTFDCIFILFTEGFTFTIEMWLAKDVGIVKWGANRPNPPTLAFQYYVLKEYN